MRGMLVLPVLNIRDESKFIPIGEVISYRSGLCNSMGTNSWLEEEENWSCLESELY